MAAEMPIMNQMSYVNSSTSLGTALAGAASGLMAQGQVHRAFIQPSIMTGKLYEQKEEMPMPAITTRRLVQVFILDPDENVPLDKALLYQGEQVLTDLNDQELYYDIDIKAVIERHNAYRVTVVNKEIKERTEHLEPVRVRDLRMTVVTIASF